MTLDRGELTSAGCAVGLLVLMFAFAWYGVDGLPGRGGSRVVWSEDAWHALGVIRWVMLVTIGTALGGVLIHWHQRGHGARTSTAPWVGSLGLMTALLLIFRVLIDLPAPSKVPDQKLGAVLGVLSAVGIAVGGWESLRAEGLPVASDARPGRRRGRGRVGAP